PSSSTATSSSGSSRPWAQRRNRRFSSTAPPPPSSSRSSRTRSSPTSSPTSGHTATEPQQTFLLWLLIYNFLCSQIFLKSQLPQTYGLGVAVNFCCLIKSMSSINLCFNSSLSFSLPINDIFLFSSK
ncbi:MAG: hypothetical protein UT02_C0011G0001, partial [Parcubacteria group bacterium GW2011_GWC2_38_7]